jgi:hypothetical protein
VPSFPSATPTAQNGSRSMLIQAIRGVIAYAILPNAPFWIAGLYFVSPARAVFNLDYLVVGILGLFLTSRVVIPLFVVVFLMDVLSSTASFYFFSQHDLISAARFVTELPWQRTIDTAAILLVLGAVVALLARVTVGNYSPNTRRPVLAVLGGLLVVLAGLQAAHGVHLHQDYFSGRKLANSTVLKMSIVIWETAFEKESETLAPVHSATEPLFARLRSRMPTDVPDSPQRNIILIVVESWGLMNDDESAAKLESPYHSPSVSARYAIETGRVEFQGATVSGEVRELCGLQGQLISVQRAKELAPECLPDLLKKQRYETTAIHGFVGVMFDRNVWYNQLGFQKAVFMEDLIRAPMFHRCGGAISGICDSDIASFLGRLSHSSCCTKPQFFYWMTLNSHLPIQISTETSAILGCGSNTAPNPDMAICDWMALVYKVNSAVANLSTDAQLPPTEFIIVGDHAPPFLSSKRRDQFSQRVVPSVHLLPKDPPPA